MLMTVLTERKKVRFISGDTECAAWHYPGTNGACVIMAGGGAVTKEPGTDLFARRFHEAGFNVLAFDYRRLGESGGQPRQVIRIREQLTDWQAAIAFAAGLPGVDPARLAIWGFSLSGGHVFRVAAGTTSRSSASTSKPSRLSCPSCAGICLITRHRTGPPLRDPRRTEADEREADRVVRRDDRILRHRWRPAGACAAARADDGCLTLGRADG